MPKTKPKARTKGIGRKLPVPPPQHRHRPDLPVRSMSAPDHLLARIYALRDLVKLAQTQAMALELDIPPSDKDRAWSDVSRAGQHLGGVHAQLDNCATSLEVRAAVARLPADATDDEHEAAIQRAVKEHVRP